MTETVLFWLFSILAVGGAAGVVLASNPVNGAMALVGSFFALAGLYLLLSAQLLAALQILVYTGAIMVLFLFVIMLLNLSPQELGRDRLTPARAAGALAALGATGLLATTFLRLRFPPAAVSHQFGTVASVGLELFSDFTLPFEATSLLLLAAILGAVVVAKGKL
ncbi:MAG TPA: NADH-quinone oxidoreductase subunit J [Myxococcales bacterium]|nr:NADH-quinone oxidoreductase subunit J [Myxococcales bacterium]